MKLAWKRMDQSVENKLQRIDHLGGLDWEVKTRESQKKAVCHHICHFGFNIRTSVLQMLNTKV